MKEEISALEKNNTWTLTKLPPGRSAVTCRWVYKLKRHLDGSIDRYRARLVARGFSQRHGLDHSETLARILLSQAAQLDLHMVQFDVRTAFLHGNLDEEIFVTQPDGCIKDKSLVYKLNKSLYGLKQASKCWNDDFTKFRKLYNLTPIHKDTCVFVNKHKESTLMIALYVDDILVFSDKVETLNKVIEYLKQKFEISILETKCFLGLELHRDRERRRIFITQRRYINKVVERFELNHGKAVSTLFDVHQRLGKDGCLDGKDHATINVPYREAIVALLYISQRARPDIAFADSVRARLSGCWDRSNSGLVV